MAGNTRCTMRRHNSEKNPVLGRMPASAKKLACLRPANNTSSRLRKAVRSDSSLSINSQSAVKRALASKELSALAGRKASTRLMHCASGSAFSSDMARSAAINARLEVLFEVTGSDEGRYDGSNDLSDDGIAGVHCIGHEPAHQSLRQTYFCRQMATRCDGASTCAGYNRSTIQSWFLFSRCRRCLPTNRSPT